MLGSKGAEEQYFKGVLSSSGCGGRERRKLGMGPSSPANVMWYFLTSFQNSVRLNCSRSTRRALYRDAM